MTVKYFEDFDVVPCIYSVGIRLYSVKPGYTISFRYEKEDGTKDNYTLYVTNVDSQHISGWCKERNDFRKFTRGNILMNGIYTAVHFLTNKPKEQTVNKEFPLIDGLTPAENLQIAKMRHPDKKWVIEGRKVVQERKKLSIQKEGQYIKLYIDDVPHLSMNEAVQTVNGYHVSHVSIVINALEKAIKALKE